MFAPLPVKRSTSKVISSVAELTLVGSKLFVSVDASVLKPGRTTAIGSLTR